MPSQQTLRRPPGQERAKVTTSRDTPVSSVQVSHMLLRCLSESSPDYLSKRPHGMHEDEDLGQQGQSGRQRQARSPQRLTRRGPAVIPVTARCGAQYPGHSHRHSRSLLLIGFSPGPGGSSRYISHWTSKHTDYLPKATDQVGRGPRTQSSDSRTGVF